MFCYCFYFQRAKLRFICDTGVKTLILATRKHPECYYEHYLPSLSITQVTWRCSVIEVISTFLTKIIFKLLSLLSSIFTFLFDHFLTSHRSCSSLHSLFNAKDSANRMQKAKLAWDFCWGAAYLIQKSLHK